jgi:hypothetical protein
VTTKSKATISLKLVAVVLVQLANQSFAEGPLPKVELVSVAKIWDKAPHNAFTDLIRFHDQWFCAFRESQSHTAGAGKLRVLSSLDGREWTSTAELSLDGYDLRDACLSETPDGRLMLLGGAQQVDDGKRPTGTVVSFSSDGEEWSPPKIVLPLGQWLWRVTWHEGTAYGMAYGTKPGESLTLETTKDGLAYKPIKMRSPLPSGWPTEARIRFDGNGEALCLQRRDGAENTALLGRAKPPYDKWQWTDLGKFLGGPNFIRRPSGQWIAAGRIIGKKPHAVVALLDVEKGELTPLLTLPSGGDCSYPGMVFHDGLLWISYYSSHEGKTSIYLAKVRLQ